MRKKDKTKRILLVCLVAAVILGALAVALLLGINSWVKSSVRDYILTEEQAAQLTDLDCILVLGCKVGADGTLSHMLEDRLRQGVALYELGAAPKLLMSGDHGTPEYDEVDAMKRYAVDAGIASQDVFMDHAGFSTYESVYRAKEVFEVQRVIIVTQEYHLYRALMVAREMGLEAYGVAVNYRTYVGQTSRDIREILARVKDFGMTIFWPEPTYLGDVIPISGNGELTHDEKSNFQ
jgi:vancomycin permeability regulator SanA